MIYEIVIFSTTWNAWTIRKGLFRQADFPKCFRQVYLSNNEESHCTLNRFYCANTQVKNVLLIGCQVQTKDFYQRKDGNLATLARESSPFAGSHQCAHISRREHERPCRNGGRSIGEGRTRGWALAHLHGRHGFRDGPVLSSAHFSGSTLFFLTIGYLRRKIYCTSYRWPIKIKFPNYFHLILKTIFVCWLP